MPGSYSIDLRERVLAACEAGEGSQGEIARRFRIGERTVSAWLRAAREGRRGPKPHGGGRPPVGGRAATLAELVAERNDASLAAYAEQLAARTGVRRSLAAVCRALTALGLVRKKSRFMRPSRIARMSSGRGTPGGPSWPASTHVGLSSSMRVGSIPG
jgi:transposase